MEAGGGHSRESRLLGLLRVGVASSFSTDALRPYSLIGRAGQGHGQNSPPNPIPKNNRVLQHSPPQRGHRRSASTCPLSAITGLMQRSRGLFDVAKMK